MRACAREVVMFSTVIFLLAMEVVQFISLGPYASLSELRLYFNFDNLIQLIVIVLAAGCGFVNCIPVFIAKEDYWQKRFKDRGLPIVGDDIKSQVGATIVHSVLARLFEDRGVRLDRTYQLNFGGNTDFLNMLERSRLKSKKISKTNAVQSQLEKELPTDDVHIGPSDHVPWLEDRKWAYIRLEGTSWGDVPLNVCLLYTSPSPRD